MKKYSHVWQLTWMRRFEKSWTCCIWSQEQFPYRSAVVSIVHSSISQVHAEIYRDVCIRVVQKASSTNERLFVRRNGCSHVNMPSRTYVYIKYLLQTSVDPFKTQMWRCRCEAEINDNVEGIYDLTSTCSATMMFRASVRSHMHASQVSLYPRICEPWDLNER